VTAMASMWKTFSNIISFKKENLSPKKKILIASSPISSNSSDHHQIDYTVLKSPSITLLDEESLQSSIGSSSHRNSSVFSTPKITSLKSRVPSVSTVSSKISSSSVTAESIIANYDKAWNLLRQPDLNVRDSKLFDTVEFQGFSKDQATKIFTLLISKVCIQENHIYASTGTKNPEILKGNLMIFLTYCLHE
jgi:hypothetical protein